MTGAFLYCMDRELIEKAVKLIRKSKYVVAFTGAGVSVESGIPAFRGKNGTWENHHPIFLEIDFFKRKPLQSWKKIKELFYDTLLDAQPNEAHILLSKMQERHFIESIITQNIDHLHQKAGSKIVHEIHGTYKQLVCTECQTEFDMGFANLDFLPPTCYICKGILKPDMVFFNEDLPYMALKNSFSEAEKCDMMIVIGTKAEVFPAADIPVKAKENGAVIIEINTSPSHLTNEVTDIFLEGKATDVLAEIGEKLYL